MIGLPFCTAFSRVQFPERVQFATVKLVRDSLGAIDTPGACVNSLNFWKECQSV